MKNNALCDSPTYTDVTDLLINMSSDFNVCVFAHLNTVQ